MKASHQPDTPWYREFWAWFVIGLLATSVLFSVSMLGIAVLNPEHLVVSNYYEVGKGINRSLAREELARRLHIRAVLEFDELSGQVNLQLVGSQPPQLVVNLISPTQPERDRHMVLQRTEHNPTQYQGFLPEIADQPLKGRRFIEILGQEGTQEWRLYDERTLSPQQPLELTP